MEKFKKELKKQGDKGFATIKNKYRAKVSRKGTFDKLSNNLGVYEKVLTETNDMLLKIANEEYPKHGLTKDKATKIVTDQMRLYMVEIKKLTGF